MEWGPPPRSGKRQPLNIGWEHAEGEVAEFECREAAVFAHLSWPEFEALHWSEKARVVAHYRVHNQIEAWQSWHATQGS